MATFISAIETAIDVFEAVRRGYRFGIVCVAYIWLAGCFCFYLGRAVRDRYEAIGGNDWALEQLAPTIAVLKVMAAWLIDAAEWGVNDGVDVAYGWALNAIALVEWACVELVADREPVVLFLERA